MAEKIRFSDRTLAALPVPETGRAEYIDTEMGGLRLRVAASGVKTFCLLRRVKNGPMERVTLGRFPDDLKTEGARRTAAQLNGAIAGGANPAEIKRAHKGEPTFADLFAEYMERHAKPNKRTWREDEQKFRDYLEKPLGKKKLSKITRQDLAAIHLGLTKDGHPILANRVKDLLSSVFGKAVAWGLIETNPAKGIADNREKSRERFLRPHELPRIFASLAEENDTFRDFFLLALLTGARRANVAGMRWQDVDLTGGMWIVPGEASKNGEPLHIPLVPEAVSILTDRREIAKGVYVFPATNEDSKRGHTSGERKAWLRVLDRDELKQLKVRIEAVGGAVRTDLSIGRCLKLAREQAAQFKIDTTGTRLDDVHIHDLRRSLGSWQARTGASLVVIGKSLGHRSQAATAIYARLDTDPVRQAMETATAAMLEAAGVKEKGETTPITGKAA